MTKPIPAFLLITFTMFLSCNRTKPVPPEPETTDKASSTAQDATNVTVSFSGLMVFHREEKEPGYEVGIVKDSDHEFKVDVDGNPIGHDRLPKARSWTLKITNPTVTTPIAPWEKGHKGRRPDDKDGQFDFSWIIDLEGKEFHEGEKLDLKPGLLEPIIHLPPGQLSTKYKSLDLKRRKSSGKDSDFGFVPETIALTLKLLPNQELILTDGTTVAFKLGHISSTGPHPGGYAISITNRRDPPSDKSDFHLYYGLFKNKLDQYVFTPQDVGSRLDPLNPYPGYYTKTCCMMACTAILLGKREKALE